MTPPYSHAAQAADSLCPDSEVLAAWMDQGLGAAERADVETHLASCDECRILIAHVLEIRDAVGESEVPGAADAPDTSFPGAAQRPTGTARAPRAMMRWAATSVLAAAAALLLAVAPPSWWSGRFSSGASSKLADLANAVGQERTVEARLTGGFRYGPLRAPVRSGGSSATTDNWKLHGAAGRIRENAEQDPSAPNLHALGLAHLLLGDYDAAVQALEDAIADDPRHPRYQSDLAAAYLARAKQLNRPDDFPRALAAAERSILGDGSLLEAYFNRALALQALFLDDQARRAWSDYLTRDAASEWAEEAQRHLAALQRSAVEVEQARNNSPPPLTNRTVEAALDWVLRKGLPAWAAAVLADDPVRASREQSTLTTYAQHLTDASGDPFAISLA